VNLNGNFFSKHHSLAFLFGEIGPWAANDEYDDGSDYIFRKGEIFS
jgi:hypothetical protein